jgi:hypothetical protein
VGALSTDLPPEAYQDAPWVHVLPWLTHYPAGTLRQLTDLSPAPDWWLTESPALTTMVVDHFDLCTALARVLITRHPESPLGQSLPTLPPQLPLSTLPAGSRVRTTFQRLDAHTVRDLADVTVKDMFDTRGTGPGTVEEAVTALIAAAITQPPDDLPDIRTSGENRPHGTTATAQPAAHAQLLEDLSRVAGWRHIRALPDTPLFAIAVEAMAPEEVQEAVQRINSLTATDVLPTSTRAHPVEELTMLVAHLDEQQRTLLHSRFLASVPSDHADIAAVLAIPTEKVRHIEVQLHELLARTFHFGTGVGNLLASIRVEIQPVAALDRLIGLHPELADRIPVLNVPLWHVLDRLDDYFEVTNGWAAAPDTGAAREQTRTWLEDAASPYGAAAIDDLASTRTMPRSELIAWVEWCGYPVSHGHVLTRTATIADHTAGLLAVAGKPVTAEAIIREINPAPHPQVLHDALDSDGRFLQTAPSTWALVDPEVAPDADLRERIAVHVNAAGGDVDLHDLIGLISNELDATASDILEAIPPTGFDIVEGRVQRRTTAHPPRKNPAETRRLFQHADGWRLRTPVTRDHLRGSGFPIPVAVPAIVGCAEGGTVELESRLGTQTIRWTGSQPVSGSIRRFLDDLGMIEGQVVFLDFRHDGRFDVTAELHVRDGAKPLASALALTGAAPVDDDDDAIAMLAAAAGLPVDAKPRQVLSAYQQRGDEDIARKLEALWTRPSRTAASGSTSSRTDDVGQPLMEAAAEQPPAAEVETYAPAESSPDHSSDWIPVPDGYRSVGWIRPTEAQAAIDAYRRRRDIPILNDDLVVGWARYDPDGSVQSRPVDADVQLVRVSTHRERVVCRITEYEAAAIVSAASRGRTVMFSPPGKNWSGRVEYHSVNSPAATQFRSTTRLLRIRSTGQMEDPLMDHEPPAGLRTSTGA